MENAFYMYNTQTAYKYKSRRNPWKGNAMEVNPDGSWRIHGRVDSISHYDGTPGLNEPKYKHHYPMSGHLGLDAEKLESHRLEPPDYESYDKMPVSDDAFHYVWDSVQLVAAFRANWSSAVKTKAAGEQLQSDGTTGHSDSLSEELSSQILEVYNKAQALLDQIFR